MLYIKAYYKIVLDARVYRVKLIFNSLNMDSPNFFLSRHGY